MPTVLAPAPSSTTAPVSCSQFSWCTKTAPGHSVHQSAPVLLPGGSDCLVFAETDPDSGALLYGPVLSTGVADSPVSHGRVLAAELRVAAARVEALVARVELAGGAA